MQPVINTEETTIVLSEKSYNYLKFVVQVVLPGLGSLYFGLSQIWGLPGGEEVVGTFALLAVFFGLILRVSTKRYYASGAQYDGVVVPKVDGGGVKGYSMELNDYPENLQFKDEVRLKVTPQEFVE